MTIGIAGLGLIGGSLAKAYSAAGERVLGWNRSTAITKYAMMAGDVHGELTADTMRECDCIFVCVYPLSAEKYIWDIAPYVARNTVVIDCCGTKRRICAAGFEAAEKYGFTFVGGHPMAGSQYSGYKYSRANMYHGASMILVPPRSDIRLFQRVKELLAPAGFGSLTFTTAEEHDEIIAYTSQMCHIVSNAFVKSPTAEKHRGFSAGSYRDLTRVAWLNEGMWTELFMENREHLICELDRMISYLGEYKTAIEAGDKETLCALLADGRKCKERIDGDEDNQN